MIQHYNEHKLQIERTLWFTTRRRFTTNDTESNKINETAH